jgi:hypothetical protein
MSIDLNSYLYDLYEDHVLNAKEGDDRTYFSNLPPDVYRRYIRRFEYYTLPHIGGYIYTNSGETIGFDIKNGNIHEYYVLDKLRKYYEPLPIEKRTIKFDETGKIIFDSRHPS